MAMKMKKIEDNMGIFEDEGDGLMGYGFTKVYYAYEPKRYKRKLKLSELIEEKKREGKKMIYINGLGGVSIWG